MDNGALVSFLAGHEGVHHVRPVPDRGQVRLTINDEDELMHLCYKNLKSDQVEDDLIVFPGDAKLVKIDACTTGRVYCLKFSSSSQRLFFWLQSPPENLEEPAVASEEDRRIIERANELMGEERMDVDTAESQDYPMNRTSTNDHEDHILPIQSRPEANRLQSLIQGIQVPQRGAIRDDLSLASLLRPTAVDSTLASLENDLQSHLPQGFNTREVLDSTQYKQALESFTRALRLGALQGVCESLHLECFEEDNGVEGFVEALRRKWSKN